MRIAEIEVALDVGKHPEIAPDGSVVVHDAPRELSAEETAVSAAAIAHNAKVDAVMARFGVSRNPVTRDMAEGIVELVEALRAERAARFEAVPRERAFDYWRDRCGLAEENLAVANNRIATLEQGLREVSQMCVSEPDAAQFAFRLADGSAMPSSIGTCVACEMTRASGITDHGVSHTCGGG